MHLGVERLNAFVVHRRYLSQEWAGHPKSRKTTLPSGLKVVPWVGVVEEPTDQVGFVDELPEGLSPLSAQLNRFGSSLIKPQTLNPFRGQNPTRRVAPNDRRNLDVWIIGKEC